MAQVYLLRHAQSTFNQDRTGAKDCNISALGKEQAGKLFGYYNLILISPMRRSHQTLLYSKITGDKIIISPNIREVKESICDFLEEEEEIQETKEELQTRIQKFHEELEEYKKKYPKILVITHRFFINALVGKLTINCEMIEYC